MRFALLLPLLAFTLTGCSDADAEKLRRAGDKTYDRISSLAQQTLDELGHTLLKQSTAPAEPSVLSKVQQRLLWDRDLTQLPIVASITGAAITLTGTVQTAVQKDKALALAEQTTGVGSVTNELKVAKEAIEE